MPNGSMLKANKSNNSSLINLYDVQKIYKSNSRAHTALHDAARNLNSIKEISQYLDNNINTLDDQGIGNTPLIYAVGKNTLEVIKFLIKNGANINQANDLGYTPLHKAIIRGDNDIIKELIENNANVNSQSLSGETPLHLAYLYNNQNAINLIKKHNPDLTIKNRYDCTPQDIKDFLKECEEYINKENEYNYQVIGQDTIDNET